MLLENSFVQFPSASSPWVNGRPPHIPFGPGRLPRVCLLPGDPERVNLAAQVLDDFSILGNKREFRLGIGSYESRQIAICSTGIGGPSTEISIIELFHLGVRTFIRVGGMGSLNLDIRPGALTYVSSVVANSGAAKHYRFDQEPLSASPELVTEIQRVALEQKLKVFPITAMSSDSYYLGQGRSIDRESKTDGDFLMRIKSQGIDAIEMEAETIFAVSKRLDCTFGAILTTHGNRLSDEWLNDYESAQLRMLEFASCVASKFA